MFYQGKQTKHHLYLTAGGQFYDGTDPLDLDTLQDQQRATIKAPAGWVALGKHDTPAAALAAFTAYLDRERTEAMRRAELAAKWAAEQQVREWEAIKDLNPIPATPENIRTLLRHLAGQNWGSWTLPRLSIGYAAHQYDCDGHPAVTITLDQAITYDGAPVRRFKIGGRHGHLDKYTTLH